MACECTQASAQSESERATLRVALLLNAAMFVVGTTAGFWAQSAGLMADALDMLADASAYALTLLAVDRGPAFRRNAARFGGTLLLMLGAGIVLDVIRRSVLGSEPQGAAMMLFSVASFVVNLSVLRMLGRFRHGEVHLRATWLFTRVDVIANLAVFASGLAVSFTGLRAADLVVGLAIGLYVAKEAVEILKEAGHADDAQGAGDRCRS